MANRARVKRDDRRARYTKMVIHDAFFELLESEGFDKMSVTDICKRADVNRGTFYLHYEDKYALLDELIDEALDNVAVIEPDGELPLCQRVPDQGKYRLLFTDPNLLARLTRHIIERGADVVVPQIMERTGLGRDDAYTLFVFIANGNIALNQALGWKRNLKLEHAHELVNVLTESGLDALQQLVTRR